MNEFVKLAARVADLERRVKGMCRQGTVEPGTVDAAAGTCRLRLGDDPDGSPYLTGPIPYAQTGGAVKVHNPPSDGQQMVAMSPDGDLRNAIAQPMGFSDANASPSGAGDQHVVTFGVVTITMAGDGLVIAVGGVSVAVNSAGFHVTGGAVDHNGTNIGDDHAHSGITPGPEDTGPPV